MELEKQNETVAKIMAGESPTIAELELLAPKFKLLKEVVDAVGKHFQKRVIDDGMEVHGIKLKAGAKRKSLKSMKSVEEKVREYQGDEFNELLWKKHLSMSAGDLMKYACACEGTTPTAKAGKEIVAAIEEALGDDLQVKQNRPSLDFQ